MPEYMYLDTSFAGSYYVSCDVIEERDTTYVIRYFDSTLGEGVEMEVSKDRVEVNETAYKVTKLNGRLWVIDGNDMPVYTPPEFLRKHITSREQLAYVAEAFNKRRGYDIDAVMDFERLVRKTG